MTGGCGFIGSHLVENLVASGHSVRILDDLSTGTRENCHECAELIVGDVADPFVAGSAMRDMDGCFHLAAIASVQKSIDQWLETHRVNASGTVSILSAARLNKTSKPIPVVFASSAAVYGHTQARAVTEKHRTSPISAYGADKLASELHAAVATKIFDIPTTALRFFNVYGPRQDPSSPYSGVLSIFLKKILDGHHVTVFGSGQQSRDFIFIDDVVLALSSAMYKHTNRFNVYNVCTGKPTSLLQALSAIMDVTNISATVRFESAREGDIMHSLGSNDLLRKELNISPQHSIHNGIEKTINYMRKINVISN